jgi:DNA polymerase IV
LYTPNDLFISELKKIKTARLLNGDEIGVRAYSTSIASLAAYPHTLTSAQEILALPGCDHKIAILYQEWKTSGGIAAVEELEADERLKILKLFYEIWGVGATTARDFYAKGWRDLDDVVEFGWTSLSRVQQIGVKYYEEFQEKIPRAEVKAIGDIVLAHANTIHPGFHMCIVGGYRRGKKESGDVDVVLSHPNEDYTLGFVQKIVAALEKGLWITHTLTLSLTNSERGQAPVSWKGDKVRKSTGFDTLDKALVVWQNPSWPSKSADLAKDPKAKNPAAHRRVDIIISPWKTVGCAVAGWTSGTTFQRDMRRYAKKMKNLKFDSSGIRSQEDGRWMDFESLDGVPAPDMETAERRVFEGLGSEWRDPSERCTG